MRALGHLRGDIVTLSVQSRRVGDIIVLACNGRIVEGDESASLQQRVAAALDDSPWIVLHVGAVDFFDSSGLGLLVRLLNKAREARGDLKLCGVPSRLKDVLRITRLHRVLDAYDSEAEAISAFYRRDAGPGGLDRLESDVLCVSGSADVLAYVCGILRQAGYAAMASANLPDAVVLLKVSRPRVVVVDAALRSAGTGASSAFNDLVSAVPLVELPAGFSSGEAGETGARLLEQVRAAIGGPSA
jgi:anti-anti-sigma factor